MKKVEKKSEKHVDIKAFRRHLLKVFKDFEHRREHGTLSRHLPKENTPGEWWYAFRSFCDEPDLSDDGDG
jgi:hypothetical protein